MRERGGGRLGEGAFDWDGTRGRPGSESGYRGLVWLVVCTAWMMDMGVQISVENMNAREKVRELKSKPSTLLVG